MSPETYIELLMSCTEINVLYDPKHNEELLCNLLNMLNYIKPHSMRIIYVFNAIQNKKIFFLSNLGYSILPLEVDTCTYRNIPSENSPKMKNSSFVYAQPMLYIENLCTTSLPLIPQIFLDNENKLLYIMSCNEKCVLHFVDKD